MNIETFYTGGGLWLTEVVINDKGDYAVIGSDFPDILSVYHKAEDEDSKYMPEDMYISKPFEELDDDLKELHSKMLDDLRKKVE